MHTCRANGAIPETPNSKTAAEKKRFRQPLLSLSYTSYHQKKNLRLMGLIAVNIQAKTSGILSASNTGTCLERPRNRQFSHHLKSEEKKGETGEF